ncbi:hypothetical protein C1645_829224 [Glomus cerebriforme]|uniref:Uncharacterized protein n=1 Tax=Glomus cerebriforme TaxID=658196 RepID=A0A397SJU1_9GLOM|nr:hypothetical protein C1645_829224 [Glomus cerebriforme]
MANNDPETVAQLYGLVVPPVSELIRKTLADSYKLLLELVGDLIPIQEKLNIDGNPVLEVEYQSNEASTDISLGEIFNLLMYLEEDIIAIQEKLNIVGYTNQGMAEEADKNARAYLQKFEEYHGPLEDVPTRIQRSLNLLDKSSIIKLSKDATSLGASCGIPRLSLRVHRLHLGKVPELARNSQHEYFD